MCVIRIDFSLAVCYDMDASDEREILYYVWFVLIKTDDIHTTASCPGSFFAQNCLEFLRQKFLKTS